MPQGRRGGQGRKKCVWRSLWCFVRQKDAMWPSSLLYSGRCSPKKGTFFISGRRKIKQTTNTMSEVLMQDAPHTHPTVLRRVTSLFSALLWSGYEACSQGIDKAPRIKICIKRAVIPNGSVYKAPGWEGGEGCLNLIHGLELNK